MKFQAYMGVSPQTVEILRQNGYEAVHLIEEGLERLEDSLILEKARLEGRIVLTFDLDFGDLLAASGDALPSVIIFRQAEYNTEFCFGKTASSFSRMQSRFGNWCNYNRPG
ncbi:DUF5615 family PIN-like protein [Microseira wollei]|uniref:DUF5615 domain-containing protein n=1 Tax=Microseira wollei NIES-4236 TaxID=2530354 RepID=A0AAV3X237_9CYAN|nr:DUF5615 family PIN-like protein [Microseira wollei]GET36003.1 hypothetical protein MiSe_07510 [Microseira wollei NIES-4236]